MVLLASLSKRCSCKRDLSLFGWTFDRMSVIILHTSSSWRLKETSERRDQIRRVEERYRKRALQMSWKSRSSERSVSRETKREQNNGAALLENTDWNLRSFVFREQHVDTVHTCIELGESSPTRWKLGKQCFWAEVKLHLSISSLKHEWNMITNDLCRCEFPEATSHDTV